ncbi:hypothetical protein QC762_500925 [Podospora pseudocomata]|uniref:Uncharacterized protein n=1 Tax=Podospora pseudocomata TaxID=2093779 RepID=A0ABR0GAC0_9PEZI|nr:hypothetical protein QC762_500925 [Podospora pseudocomata]
MDDSSDDERHCKIDLKDRAGVVEWEDANRHLQHTPDLRMDVHVDASNDRALFALHGCIFLKGGKPNKVSVYIFVHPENIHSVGYDHSTGPSIPAMQRDPSKNFISLRFSMTQAPVFVVPKNRPLVPKARSEGLLDTMKALASAQDFTVYLNMLQLVPEVRYQLSLLPSVFLFNDLQTDERWAAIGRLYHGAGGQVVNLGNTAAAPRPTPSCDNLVMETLEELSPPPYVEKAPYQNPTQLATPPDRKRRRTSEPLSSSRTDKRLLLDLGQGRVFRENNAELESRIERLEKMFQDSTPGQAVQGYTGLESRIERLEMMILEPAARSPCRYNSEEAEHLISHVNDRIDDQFTGVHVELQDKVMEDTERLVTEKTEESQEELRKGLRETLMEELREELMDKLRVELLGTIREEVKRELMAEIKVELFRDMAQAMMGVACGTSSEKAKMALNSI